jgi:anti-sigma factor RsiW
MSHPPTDLLEAMASGLVSEGEAQFVRAHATGCSRCGSILSHDEQVHRRLALLRESTPRIEVADQVMRRLDEMPRARVWPRLARVALALALVLAGVLVANNGGLGRSLRRIAAIASL